MKIYRCRWKVELGRGGLPNFNPNANPTDVSIDRFAFAAGWYMTDNVMLKAEYVEQTYDGFATNNVLNGGKFNGVMLEAVLSF
ncbi:MAG: hypothetical protein U5L96_14680 [Owenweeksia sp.]|nr:hypothetical protein [Owenweeksia sp.]